MWRRAFAHPFIRKVSVLGRGIGLAYTLQFLSTPFLGWLYTPAEMGLYGVFLAFVSLLTMAAPLRYDVSILAADSERESWLLSATSFLATLVMSPLLVAAVFALTRYQVLGLTGLSTWVVALMLPTVAFGAWMECSRYTTLKADAFGRLSAAIVAQSVGRVTVQLSLGALGWGASGLLLGELAAKMAGCLWMVPALWRSFRQGAYEVTLGSLRQAARAHRRSPLVLLPSSLIDLLALSLTIPMVTWRFGADAAGNLSFVQRLVAGPLAVASASVADALHSEAARLRLEAPERLWGLFRGISLRLFLLGLVPTLVLVLAGPWLFSALFGPRWETAGRLSVVLAPLVLAQFVVVPLSRLVFVLQGQKLKLIYDVSSLVLLLAVFSPRLFPQAGFETTIGLYVLANCAAYGLYFVGLGWLTRRAVREA